MSLLIAFVAGIAVGGIACAVSAKTLGWFNKQAKSAETAIAAKV